MSLRILFVLLLCSVMPAARAERVALVIGNDDYQVGPLRNPVRDARAVADRLRTLGFRVISGTNLDLKQMQRTMDEFERNLSAGGIALFFYSGHGVEIEGRNYLLPVDNSGITHSSDVAGRGIEIRKLIGRMENSKAILNLVILDACRDNPLPATTRSTRGGLAPMQAQAGTLIAYSTRAGAVAADGEGQHSPYAEVLLRLLARSDLDVQQLFNRVGLEVSRATNGDQVPWFSSSPVPALSLGGRPKPIVSQSSASGPAAGGQLRLRVSPADAELFLDGSLIGRGEQLVPDLPANTQYRVEARKPGFAGEPLVVFIKSGDTTDVHLQLRADSEPAVAGAPTERADAGPLEFQDVLKDGGHGPEMLVIPGGSFMRGDALGDADEQPMRSVTVPEFAIAKYEVTVADYRRYASSRVVEIDHEARRQRIGRITAGGGNLDTLRENYACWAYDEQQGNWWWQVGLSWSEPGYAQSESHPVVCIDWKEARSYVAWLSAQTGRRYRLPTESELEYVLRAGSAQRSPWGDNPAAACQFANLADQGTHTGSAWGPGAAACVDGSWYARAVGAYRPNAFGAFDTIGNVMEWAADCYAESYARTPADGSAHAPRRCEGRVVRGGGFDTSPEQARVSNRLLVKSNVGGRAQNVGLRVAADL